MEKKIQILIIHGGMTFKNTKDYLHFLKTRKVSLQKKTSWTDDYLQDKLGQKIEIIRPRMPLQDNAKYNHWAIHFKKYITQLKGEVILIGISLGGIFLAKYLSENRLQNKVLSTYLICPPFDNTLYNEDLVGGFQLKSDLSLIESNCINLYILFSKDDDVIPVSHAKKYQQKFKRAEVIVYPSKNGHFQISKFPEIIKLIKRDISKI